MDLAKLERQAEAGEANRNTPRGVVAVTHPHHQPAGRSRTP